MGRKLSALVIRLDDPSPNSRQQQVFADHIGQQRPESDRKFPNVVIHKTHRRMQRMLIEPANAVHVVDKG